MIRNYIKIAWRNMVNNKFYSIINISGLVIGLTIGILILLWVQDETSFNGFHSNAKEIYKLENMVGTGDSKQIWQNTASPIGMLAKKNLPDVKEYSRITYNGSFSLYKYNNNVFNETNTFYTDPSFFSIFDFKLISGNPDKPFPDINSVVITQSTAKKYFGTEDPIGKVISADDKINFTVTGVIKDFPRNSSISGDMFFPMAHLAKTRYAGRQDGQTLDNDFIQYSYSTFLLMKPGADVSKMPDKLRNYHLAIKPDDVDIAYLLMPISRMHLFRSDGSEGGIETVRIFIIIAILILVIACINYINLSTARSMLRSKEVSLRKIVGAKRVQLFKQFVTETSLMFIIAVMLALFFIYILMPYFNELSGKELRINFADLNIWKIVIVTFLGTLVVSSIYPALLLSSFEPIKAIKGKVSMGISNIMFRKILVVTQFAFSVVLIAGTIIISEQLSYIRNKQLGYDKEHVISFSMRKMNDHFDAVKADLLHQPGVKDVTRASANIVMIGGQTGNNQWDGKQTGETMMVHPMAIDGNFIPFFNIRILEGKNYVGNISDSTHFILNETAVKTARIKDPIGKRFKLWNVEGTITAIVKDFHFSSMKNKIEPVVFHYRPIDMGRIYIKTTGAESPKAIYSAERAWKEYNADFPFSFAFLDEAFNSLYREEERTSLLFRFFAAIAIFISCMGLLGLAMYTSQVRTREIGVRKVLGASTAGIVKMLAADFIKLVVIAIVIAIPLAWYAMHQWLQGFVYRIDISWWVFVAAGIAALIIALLTVSFQAIKAAMANPVSSLRTE